MRPTRVILATTPLLAVAGLAGGLATPPTATAADVRVLPTYAVVRQGLNADEAARLARAFNLPDLKLLGDGSVRYLDTARFQHLPTKATDPAGRKDEDGQDTVAEAFDFDAIAKLRAIDPREAQAKVLEALKSSELLPAGAKPVADQAFFEAVDRRGGPMVAKKAIDTSVDLQLGLGGLPLVGPGAKVKVTLDPEGAVTQLQYLTRELKQDGEVPVVDPLTAKRRCVQAFGPQAGKVATPTLAYVAPPLDAKGIIAIYPQYLCQGTAANGSLLRGVTVPAVTSDLALRPRITATFDGKSVVASVRARGGKSPYSFRWSSSTTSLDPRAATRSSITYAVDPVRPATQEILTVTVTDAAGQVAVASQTFDLGSLRLGARRLAAALPAAAPESLSRVDVGLEWVGSSGGLGGSAGNAAGFVSRMGLDGVPVQFNWNDFNAWERDFKDPVNGGQDSSFVDDVDLAWYTGHAGGDGWWFPGNDDDQTLRFTDARLGNRDLEWIGIAACGPLQDSWGGQQWWQRWGNAFQGLHILAGYETISYDNTVEGSYFASNLLGLPFFGWGALPVREAWARMATDAQPSFLSDGSEIRYAVMGVYGPGGITSWNDHFWGKGPVSPDLTGSAKLGYWKVSART